MSQKPKIFYTYSWWESMTPIDLHAHKYRAIEEFGEDNVVAVEIAQPSKGTINIDAQGKFYQFLSESIMLYGDCFSDWFKTEGLSLFDAWAKKQGIDFVHLPESKGMVEKDLPGVYSTPDGQLFSHKEGSSADMNLELLAFTCWDKDGKIFDVLKFINLISTKLSAKPELVPLNGVEVFEEVMDCLEIPDDGVKRQNIGTSITDRIITKFSAPPSRVPSEEELTKAHRTAIVEWMNYDRNANLQQHSIRIGRDEFMGKAIRELLLRGEK